MHPIPSDCENGRRRRRRGISRLRPSVRATNPRYTADLRSLGQLFRIIFSRDRSGCRLYPLFIFFALAAVALVTNRMALLATRLWTMMIAIFGRFVWVPVLLSNPHDRANWSEIAETFAIAGAILADLASD